MTDYYPLIARAVAGLARSTGESRRALYDRARSALLAQLRNLDPPLAENEITRERLLLKERIRKVEADTARQQRAEPPRPSAPRPAEPAAQTRPDVPDANRSGGAGRAAAPPPPKQQRPPTRAPPAARGGPQPDRRIP